MRVTIIICICVVCCSFVSAVTAQNEYLSDTVVPITSAHVKPSLKFDAFGKFGPNPGVEADAEFGTGFCLDPNCGFIVTNYHVALATHVKKIEGQKVHRRYLATGPDDRDATLNNIANMGGVAFTAKRDLALLQLDRYVPHHHGIGFSLDELQPGQIVDIYGYPKALVNPVRKLVRLPARFKGPTSSGLIAFDYDSFDGKPIRLGGASGGIVVDRRTGKIVGVLSGANKTTVLAVPIQTLADFVTKVEPFLAKKIFPAGNEVSPVTDDVYSKFVSSQSDQLEHRRQEPSNIRALRRNAQLLAESIRNFVAVQTFAWGAGNNDNEPYATAAYEVQVINGGQQFRKYPDGQKQLEEVPFPRHVSGWVLPADEWSQLPYMVGSKLQLKVQERADVVVDARPMKIFQYYAGVEDHLCFFEPVADFGFFTKTGKPVPIPCYGEVWTDEHMNITRMSESLDFSHHPKGAGGWDQRRVVITYDWLSRMQDSPQLAPQTIYVEARYKRKHLYWCRGQFTQYREFTARSRVVTESVN